ncbi:hypothetical protein BN159_8096 [Streptomyces davaonensis JCM 4913]|uniref:DUF1876 domain-containing protein n=1 Tax=Streptomyces davaonensis (strain DSM 101723 / JCM 4913 / KCC S-0913 / 768) TaxID=1214101 RepID=K4RGU2_STRDJ|nr:DUF1876 domain-containing protein [Streptomyces davaonensis]CCK32474.1 hypothetical protein BN159_8096 [Streptomyces davaonensis JCM 4913]
MSHIAEWTVHLYLVEEEGTTKARVVLDTGSTSLTGSGTAHRNPADTDVPEIGDELAAGRALHDIAGQLVRAATQDIASRETTEPEAVYRPTVGWSI